MEVVGATREGTVTITNEAVLSRHGIDMSGLEMPDLEVPILSASQRQGDVLVRKIETRSVPGAEVIGLDGVVVVRAETASANTHTLFALSGVCRWTPNPAAADPIELVEGWLVVEETAEAVLIHTEEHNVVGIGAGTYEIRRQREFDENWQRVFD